MGIPEITRYGRFLGDWSALNNPAMVPQRFLFNRPVGHAGGRIVGGAKKYFGVIGLIAVAEFFSALQTRMRYVASTDIYLGSMANYAEWVDRGWTHPSSGTQVEPWPFFTAAVKEVQAEDLGAGGFTLNPFSRTMKATTNQTTIRTGVYEGQKFLGDLGQFAKDASLGGLGGRFLRREAGKQVSGFLFNSLRAKQNPTVVLAERILTKADRFLIGKQDTGILKASLAYGETMKDFEDRSIKQIRSAGVKAGLSDREINRKIAGGAGANSAYVTI
jgi:hypothetical protein